MVLQLRPYISGTLHTTMCALCYIIMHLLLLCECRTLWDECERATLWFGNVAEFEQGQHRCCRHHMTGKQRVATTVFSQHHHENMVLRCFVFLNYHLQYVFWTLCLSWQFACFITYNVSVAARAMLQQHRGCNFCVHPDVNDSYAHYITCANTLRSSISVMYIRVIFHDVTCQFWSGDVTSSLMTSHPWQIDRHHLTTNSVGLTREHY